MGFRIRISLVQALAPLLPTVTNRAGTAASPDADPVACCGVSEGLTHCRQLIRGIMELFKRFIALLGLIFHHRLSHAV